MSKTTLSAHETINYLDNVLNEEEKRCEYSHQWRNFTISRSGRYKSKNKKRDGIDGKFFETHNNSTTLAVSSQPAAIATTIATIKSKDDRNMTISYMEHDKNIYRQPTTANKPFQQSSSSSASYNKVRGKTETYKSFYETNL